ncbi:MAG: GNAT family N-acetyltransferase, partial [Cyanothece sp. SIO1E1]|nr:GNAT family N-acetyltransferase [Cyanothece sp. SIO1E1]
MQRTYRELATDCEFAHLAATVERHFCLETPLWWVLQNVEIRQENVIGCLWMGNAIDQMTGDRHAYIFLLYVAPAQRRQGIGTALMHHGEAWARARGDGKIGLQV